ncbi:hypothetical protein SEVIR_7G138201v4 [Setaria viridis]
MLSTSSSSRSKIAVIAATICFGSSPDEFLQNLFNWAKLVGGEPQLATEVPLGALYSRLAWLLGEASASAYHHHVECVALPLSALQLRDEGCRRCGGEQIIDDDHPCSWLVSRPADLSVSKPRISLHGRGLRGLVLGHRKAQNFHGLTQLYYRIQPGGLGWACTVA